MEQLPEDVYTKVLTHLKVKDAFKCKTLNKGYNRQMSSRSYIINLSKCLSRENTIIFHCSRSASLYFYAIGPHKSLFFEELDQRALILASTFGLLLVYFELGSIYCLCNPITEQYQLLYFKGHNYQTWLAGLAVDPVRSLFYPEYNIVILICTESGYQFLMYTPGKYPSIVARTMVVPTENLDEFAKPTKSVHLKGSLHWLRHQGSIVVFNTKKEDSHIIRSPPGFEHGNQLWFGAVQGMITIISCSKVETVIYILENYEEEKWVVKARIDINITEHGRVVLFDGKELIIQSPIRENLVFDINKKAFTMIGELLSFTDGGQSYDYFSPSLAKVSPIYYNVIASENTDEIKDSIGNLCKFFACSR